MFCEKRKTLDLDSSMDGELQFEAAVSSTVGLLKAPINDLSRGYNALEVYSMAIITVVLLG